MAPKMYGVASCYDMEMDMKKGGTYVANINPLQMQAKEQSQVDPDHGVQMGHVVPASCPPQQRLEEEDGSSVSSSWMTELLQDCFCKDTELVLDNALFPRGVQIEQSVKVRCLAAKYR